jgi:hypothetical protein
MYMRITLIILACLCAYPAASAGIYGYWVDSIEVGNAKAGPFPIIVHESDLRGSRWSSGP